MSRQPRAASSTYYAQLTVGATAALPAVADTLYELRSLTVAGVGGDTVVTVTDSSGGITALSALSGTSETVAFAGGIETTKSSAVTITVAGATANVTLTYVAYDLSAPVTKSEARKATYDLQVALNAAGRKAIRQPNTLNLNK